MFFYVCPYVLLAFGLSLGGARVDPGLNEQVIALLGAALKNPQGNARKSFERIRKS